MDTSSRALERIHRIFRQIHYDGTKTFAAVKGLDAHASNAALYQPPTLSEPHAVSTDEEKLAFAEDLLQTRRFLSNPRFSCIHRSYNAETLAKFAQPPHSFPRSNAAATRFYNTLRQCQEAGKHTLAMGVLDGLQAIQCAPYHSSVFVSGWQASTLDSSFTSASSSPGSGNLSIESVPRKVASIFDVQLSHLQRQREARLRMPVEQQLNPTLQQQQQQHPQLPSLSPSPSRLVRVQYDTPIVAEVCGSHGITANVMRSVRMLVEAGAASVVIDDQRYGYAKITPSSGKVLVSTWEFSSRLQSARLQCDMLRAYTVIMARTDAMSATHVDSNSDEADSPFILGATNPALGPLRRVFDEAESKGLSLAEIYKLQTTWEKKAGLRTYSAAVMNALEDSDVPNKEHAIREWRERSSRLSLEKARELAICLGVNPYWCWDKPRSREGFYRVRGGVEMAIARAVAVCQRASPLQRSKDAPASTSSTSTSSTSLPVSPSESQHVTSLVDVVWFQTARPILRDAALFASAVKKVYPHLLLAYNMSSSFNWEAVGTPDASIASYQHDLAKLGFVWQVYSFAGFHVSALATSMLAKALVQDGALAYVRDVQRAEAQQGLESLGHHTWAGAEVLESVLAALLSKEAVSTQEASGGGGGGAGDGGNGGEATSTSAVGSATNVSSLSSISSSSSSSVLSLRERTAEQRKGGSRRGVRRQPRSSEEQFAEALG